MVAGIAGFTRMMSKLPSHSQHLVFIKLIKMHPAHGFVLTFLQQRIMLTAAYTTVWYCLSPEGYHADSAAMEALAYIGDSCMSCIRINYDRLTAHA